MIIIAITISATAMIDAIDAINMTAATMLVASIHNSTSTAVIATSLAAISERLMIVIRIKRQSTMSCTMTLAPKAPAPSLKTVLVQPLVAPHQDPVLHPLAGLWRTTTLMTKEKQVLLSSRGPTSIWMMKMAIFIFQSRMVTAFTLPLSL
jgi:hypothetical protein